MEILVFVAGLVALAVASYFFGVDSRELAPARQTDVERWSR